MKRVHVVLCATAVLLTACTNNYKRYERPVLFYPQGALQKQRIEAAASDTGVQFRGPKDPLVPGDHTYQLHVTDDSCAADGNLLIEVYPSDVATVDSRTGRERTITVKGEKLSKISSIEVQVTGCTASKPTTRWFSVSDGAGRHGKTESKIEILGPPGLGVTRSSGTYDIHIRDSSCGSNQTPDISVYPPSAYVESTPTRIQQSSGYWRIQIDSADQSLERTRSLTVRVLGCAIETIGENEARREGLLVTRSFSITDEAYSGLKTKLIPWAMDDAAEEFGRTFADSFIVADLVFVNHNSKSLLVYGSTVTAEVRFLVSEEDANRLYTDGITHDPAQAFAGPNGRELKHRLNYTEKYRPMSFSDVLAIFTYQQESNPRQRLVDQLKSLGEVLTGVAVFGVGDDYVKGVSFFTGVVNPEIEKNLLWDVLLHVKNLEDRSLKEVEEVAPHGELRRVVFFPRRPIFGVLPEVPVYIAEIRPDQATAEATVIDKEATIGTSQ